MAPDAARDRRTERAVVPDARHRRRRAAPADGERRARASRTSAACSGRAGRASSSRACIATCRCWRSRCSLVHIVTSVLDPFAGINGLDAIIPFTGTYRPIWLGLGRVRLRPVDRDRDDERRPPPSRSRAPGARRTGWPICCWPVAVVHTVGTGSDAKQVWLLALTAACVVAVVARGVGADRFRLAGAARDCAAGASLPRRAPRALRRLAPERAARHGLGAARGHAARGLHTQA